jgi:hypothetical protein
MHSRWFAVMLVLVFSALSNAADEPKKQTMSWTNDPAKMTFPDAEVAGKVAGKEFKPTFIRYDPFLRQLILSQSSGGTFPEVEVRINLLLEQKDKLDGRKFVLNPKKSGGRRPLPTLTYSPDGKKLPEMVKMPAGQTAMKLEFGAAKDGKVPGKIYLCLSDKDKSCLAGTFEVMAGK